jgi:hypothetical protein
LSEAEIYTRCARQKPPVRRRRYSCMQTVNGCVNAWKRSSQPKKLQVRLATSAGTDDQLRLATSAGTDDKLTPEMAQHT